jgi:hypothetical protein
LAELPEEDDVEDEADQEKDDEDLGPGVNVIKLYFFYFATNSGTE